MTAARRLPFRAKFIAAHRGFARQGQHENTLAAFDSAISLGADMIELDVRRLADDTLVVYHDERIGDRRLNALTQPALERLGGDVRIPAFRECARFLHGRIGLDVELKDEGIAAGVLAILSEEQWQPRDFAITSFDASMLDDARRHQPDVIIGLLTEEPDLATALARAAGIAADFLAPDQSFLDDAALALAVRAGMPLVPWVVNEPARLRMLLAHAAVAGLITDALPTAVRLAGWPHQPTS
jgi:glycerophosphoryl diester phosphodiesterase